MISEHVAAMMGSQDHPAPKREPVMADRAGAVEVTSLAAGTAAAGRDVPRGDVYRLMAEASPAGGMVVALDGTILLCNAELERQFGYGRGELVGQSVDRLVPEALRATHRLERQRFADAPVTRPMGAGRELYGRRQDGSEFPVEIGLTVAHTSEGVRIVATVVDITQHRQRERAAQRTLEDCLAFESLLGDLSAIVVQSSGGPGGVGGTLGRIGEEMGLARVTLLALEGRSDMVGGEHWARASAGRAAERVREGDLPWTFGRIRAGDVVSFSEREEVPDSTDRATYLDRGSQAGVAVPLAVSGQTDGAILFESEDVRRWTPDIVGRLRLLANLVANVLARRHAEASLLQALHETEALRDDLKAENVLLRREARRVAGAEDIVGQSSVIRQILSELQQVAATDATVLLLGETGTGKELFAQYVHELSARRDRPLVRVHCAAIPATLIESELFGREKGAYTGAMSRQMGRFELAHNSTIVLDEIGEIPPEIQVKLLRVLEDRHIERLGSTTRLKVNVRLIAATHRDLEKCVAEGTFREDLYYRLNVFPIRVPPLRERPEDIPLLVWRFVDEFSKSFGKRIDAIPDDNMEALKRHPWPGNIRELRNVVERAMIGATSRRLSIAVPSMQGTAVQRSMRLVDVERQHILSVLELTRWRIRGEHGAASRLGLKPTTLETRMAKLGLRRNNRGT